MNETDFLQQLLGDETAAEFCELLGSISQTWDDLIDKDKLTGPDRINTAFFDALVLLPANAFYRAHFERLHPLIEATVYDWTASTVLERGTFHDRSLAFVLRDSLIAVIIQCVAICRGRNEAIRQSAEVRRFYHTETAAEYLEKLG